MSKIEDRIARRVRTRVIAHVAAESGMDRTAIHKWLSGSRRLRVHEAEALARTVGLELALRPRVRK